MLVFLCSLDSRYNPFIIRRSIRYLPLHICYRCLIPFLFFLSFFFMKDYLCRTKKSFNVCFSNNIYRSPLVINYGDSTVHPGLFANRGTIYLEKWQSLKHTAFKLQNRLGSRGNQSRGVYRQSTVKASSLNHPLVATGGAKDVALESSVRLSRKSLKKRPQ